MAVLRCTAGDAMVHVVFCKTAYLDERVNAVHVLMEQSGRDTAVGSALRRRRAFSNPNYHKSKNWACVQCILFCEHLVWFCQSFVYRFDLWLAGQVFIRRALMTAAAPAGRSCREGTTNYQGELMRQAASRG